MSSSRAVTPRVPDRSRREPGLCPGELRVYVLDLSLLTRCHQEFVAVLSPDERDRAGRLVHPEARQRFEMVRGALRRILADLVGQEPDQLRFAYGQYAKPYLVSSTGAGDRQPRFNVSHSGNV